MGENHFEILKNQAKRMKKILFSYNEFFIKSYIFIIKFCYYVGDDEDKSKPL